MLGFAPKKKVYEALTKACYAKSEANCDCLTNGEFCPLRNMIIQSFSQDNSESDSYDVYKLIILFANAELPLTFIKDFIFEIEYDSSEKSE